MFVFRRLTKYIFKNKSYQLRTLNQELATVIKNCYTHNTYYFKYLLYVDGKHQNNYISIILNPDNRISIQLYPIALSIEGIRLDQKITNITYEYFKSGITQQVDKNHNKFIIYHKYGYKMAYPYKILRIFKNGTIHTVSIDGYDPSSVYHDIRLHYKNGIPKTLKHKSIDDTNPLTKYRVYQL